MAGMHTCHNKIKGSHSRDVKPKQIEPESVQGDRCWSFILIEHFVQELDHCSTSLQMYMAKHQTTVIFIRDVWGKTVNYFSSNYLSLNQNYSCSGHKYMKGEL